MTKWTIWYSTGTYDGETEEDWDAAPDHDIQAIVIHAPYPDGRRPWAGVENKQILTGEDEFSINGWKTKYGRLISDSLYFGLWKELVNGCSNSMG